jgi:hypothetical protein
MKKIIYEIVPLCLVWLCVSACVPTTPEWDSQFGESARKTAALQILNPDAGTTPVSESMEGQAGREAIGRYRNSFKEPQNNANSFVIGVGR